VRLTGSVETAAAIVTSGHAGSAVKAATARGCTVHASGMVETKHSRERDCFLEKGTDGSERMRGSEWEAAFVPLDALTRALVLRIGMGIWIT
jgi:hypothetical protein